jgi:hypothetical protein
VERNAQHAPCAPTIQAELRVLLLAGLALAGCGRTTPLPDVCASGGCPCAYAWDCPTGYDCVDRTCVRRVLPDAAVDGGDQRKGFGELCVTNDECASGYCLPDLGGAFCSQRCEDACPTGWACRQVADPRGGAAPVGLCVVDRLRLCQGCVGDDDCNPSGGDRCLDVAGSRACGRDCTYEACPTGYACTDAPGPAGGSTRQCLPLSGTCACTEASQGQLRGCVRENLLGACSGQEICAFPDGWSECSAAEPTAEICNGIDDDCDARVDEGLLPRPCVATAGPWTCRGTETCQGGAGWVCDAPTPTEEACDGADNNCDGRVDEGFRDAAGIYFTREHCGGCGVDCDQVIAHSAATECVVAGGAARCRATACDPGYFPYLDGAQCLLLPDTLCDPCATAADCVAPGSACLTVGVERFCGRDCSAASVYGPTCPTGYRCVTAAGAAQCQPVTETCLCRAEHAGTTRACTVDTCTGYETCAAAGGGWDWSSCDISHTIEICDGLDNDCDDQIDEGFLNPATGRYEADAHCGFCNNDCTKYWSAEIHHATGGCDTSPVMPVCRMETCLTETIGTIQYEWVDVNADDQDGCECLRVLGNTTYDPPDVGSFPSPGQEYRDDNCDGVDGVADRALFVWGGNPLPGTGTRTNPYRTLAAALAALPTSGKSYVLVAEGTYAENVVLLDGAKLYGGYAWNFLSRDVLLFSTVIQGVTPTAASQVGAVTAVGLGTTVTQTVVSGFTIQGRHVDAVAADGVAGAASVAVYLKDCGPAVILQNNLIFGGRGGDGGRGPTGVQGHGRQVSAALNGAAGVPSITVFGSCPAGLLRSGGAGGVNATCPAATASRGGNSVCPVFSFNVTPYQGNHQEYASPTGNQGLGGWDWSYDSMSGSGCSHVTESGWPSAIQSHNGEDGFDGDDGASGSGGTSVRGGYGSLVGGLWVPAPGAAQPGGAGTPGVAGGGGGAGGGTARFSQPGGCGSHQQGATGGGGGAGGCGGAGGGAGGAGGASIGVLVVYTTAATASGLPTIRENRFRRAMGGDGAMGGFGGSGGVGGLGAAGGPQESQAVPEWWSTSAGGKGGDGGNGGPGGGGGGGAGGPSFDVLGYNLTGDTWETSNRFDYDGNVDTGGLGGLGGGASAAGSVGAPGAPGSFDVVLVLKPCGAGGTCSAGQTCDVNNVCLPN